MLTLRSSDTHCPRTNARAHFESKNVRDTQQLVALMDQYWADSTSRCLRSSAVAEMDSAKVGIDFRIHPGTESMPILDAMRRAQSQFPQGILGQAMDDGQQISSCTMAAQ